jgi:hypothetical protein
MTKIGLRKNKLISEAVDKNFMKFFAEILRDFMIVFIMLVWQSREVPISHVKLYNCTYYSFIANERTFLLEYRIKRVPYSSEISWLQIIVGPE